MDHIEGDERLAIWTVVKKVLGRNRIEAEGFTLQSHGSAVAVLDQGEEPAVQPDRRVYVLEGREELFELR